jgi:hypothetical protein
MSISVSNSLSAPLSAAAPVAAPAANTQPDPKTEPQTAAAADTVKLSQAAQVHLLKQQGQLLSQIASKLSIPVATVDGYLGIQVAKPTATPVPAQPTEPTQAAETQGSTAASQASAKG